MDESLGTQIGIWLVRGSPQIITPAACTPVLRIDPSSFLAISITSAASASSTYSCFNSGSASNAEVMVALRSGICFAMKFTLAKGVSKVLPTSLIAILAFMVPNVIIWATLSLP
ncbi:Uncharacterised protein [Chlamydia trachomatis]|nr:Uncharacterised protein [Chlamydia trachomatis]CRH70029.1 Uncharacterised protein [Chlamydia trachomatis]CRH88514.1 Uncharacterised protein [Chlamydia trachomatis]